MWMVKVEAYHNADKDHLDKDSTPDLQLCTLVHFQLRHSDESLGKARKFPLVWSLHLSAISRIEVLLF